MWLLFQIPYLISLHFIQTSILIGFTFPDSFCVHEFDFDENLRLHGATVFIRDKSAEPGFSANKSFTMNKA